MCIIELLLYFAVLTIIPVRPEVWIAIEYALFPFSAQKHVNATRECLKLATSRNNSAGIGRYSLIASAQPDPQASKLYRLFLTILNPLIFPAEFQQTTLQKHLHQSSTCSSVRVHTVLELFQNEESDDSPAYQLHTSKEGSRGLEPQPSGEPAFEESFRSVSGDTDGSVQQLFSKQSTIRNKWT